MSSKYSVELFLEACGAPGPLHLSVEDGSRPPGPFRRVFHQPFVVIGRNPNTDLLLDHWRVSRRHAYLQLVAGRLFCVDLGSRTGTEWDDASNESGWLDPGRSIRVGPYAIGRWNDARGGSGSSAEPGSESDDAQLAAIGGPEAEPPGFDVEFLTQASRQPPIRLAQDLVLVGSSTECRVRLPHSDVSKAHCSLLRSPRGLWVVDLLGRGGIYVNETHVRFARLDDGDELRIGRHVLRFHLDDSAVRPDGLVATSGRTLARRSSSEPTPRGGRALPAVPAPPSSAVPLVPTWHYPETEVHRVLAERPSNQADMVQALMQPMVQQFGLMQQQMFEQFHQAMMAMFQSFGAFHREQMSDLREELDEVRRLTQELQELQTQAQLRESSAAATAAAPAITPASAPVPAAAPPPRRAPDSQAARPAPPRSAPAPQPRLQPKPAPAPVPAATVKPEAPEGPVFRKPPQKSDAGVHSVLFDRIAQLQNERQTRWQKILGMLNRST